MKGGCLLIFLCLSNDVAVECRIFQKRWSLWLDLSADVQQYYEASGRHGHDTELAQKFI